VRFRDRVTMPGFVRTDMSPQALRRRQKPWQSCYGASHPAMAKARRTVAQARVGAGSLKFVGTLCIAFSQGWQLPTFPDAKWTGLSAEANVNPGLFALAWFSPGGPQLAAQVAHLQRQLLRGRRALRRDRRLPLARAPGRRQRRIAVRTASLAWIHEHTGVWSCHSSPYLNCVMCMNP